MKGRVPSCCRLLFLAILIIFTAAPTWAQPTSPITFSTAYDYTFGQQATFHIQATSSSPITAVHLHLKPEGTSYSETHPVPIEPATTVTSGLQRDLRTSPFPPFGPVAWWWEIRDEAGNVLTTEPDTFLYVDNRFEWRTLSADHVQLHTVVNDPLYTQSALDVTHTALEEIASTLQVSVPDRIHLYLYPSMADLRAALEMAGREWAGGQARPELGVVLVAIPPGDSALYQMERDIPHEITHLLVYEVVGSEGYRHVPAWLDEGLATANELRPDPTLEVMLQDAHAQGRLIPLSNLCDPFPPSREAALLSYAQSASLVRYVRDRYGNSGIRSLLAVYADGAGCESGIAHAFDLSIQQLELAWRADMMGLSEWLIWFSDNATWLLLWGLSLLLAIPMVGWHRRR